MRFYLIAIAAFFAFQAPFIATAQDEEEDLLDMLEGLEEPTTDYAFATFKSSRIANSHSIETSAHGELDMVISHRFGRINTGINNLFGLDQANMRIGLAMGLTDRITIGVGRSNIQKTYDGYVKAKLLRQASGEKAFPISITGLVGSAIFTTPFPDPARENKFSDKVSYFYQMMFARKFSDRFSLQITPTLVHLNLVNAASDPNDVGALGLAGRYKLTKSTSINVEYFHLLSPFTSADVTNNLTVGFDIETGGHVFQLVFSNTRAMTENLFITQSTGQWGNGDIHFGFNIHRTFNLIDRKKPKEDSGY
ncbi:MAG: DUF5777 family beta-barrel protein [Bacteroidia bacterium]